MLFSSMTFIFIFLPIVLLFYFIASNRLKNYILLIASIIFYSWADIHYLGALLLTIFFSYFGAIIVDRNKYSFVGKNAMILTVFANICLIFYFKYFKFFLENINNIFNTDFNVLNILLPVGISFYTFQAISYVVDVYRGDCPVQKNICKLALYISFFPQLIAGPIIKYHDIANQIDSRDTDFDKFNYGVQRFIIGLSKKMLIANTLGAIVDKVFVLDPISISHGIAWLGAISYVFQLYFDFSGYSDMAIGLGYIFGFKFLENFNYPYISKSVTELWRRWHISLGTWFKQYVYIPLGGSRKGKNRTLLNLCIIFLLLGLWHGASWSFIVWGMYNGAFIIAEKFFNIKEFESKKHSLLVSVLCHIYFILNLTIGIVIFRADSLGYAIKYILNMLFLFKPDPQEYLYAIPYYVGKHEIIIFICAILCSTPLFKDFLKPKTQISKLFVNIWLLLLFFVSVATIAAESYNPFIYFKF